MYSIVMEALVGNTSAETGSSEGRPRKGGCLDGKEEEESSKGLHCLFSIRNRKN